MLVVLFFRGAGLARGVGCLVCWCVFDGSVSASLLLVVWVPYGVALLFWFVLA